MALSKVKKVKAKSKDRGELAVSLKDLKHVKQLRSAGYNPRMITDRRLADLEKSIASFGDLSGVVFNNSVKSGVLVSGHQRLSSIKGWKTRVQVDAATDDHGTVGVGYIFAESPKGKQVQIPLRVVNWSDRRAEYAANIAANAHGGEFDNKKLAQLVEKLDMTKIPAEIVGLDPLMLRGLKQRLAKQGEDLGKPTRTNGTQNGASGQFNEATVDDIESDTVHKCPRCNFKF
ncbi:putative transcriptional repressor [Erwinia phage pEa_SNUABM_5]|uniref:Putative transcriptional repressor n=1 Tax=Erwinia phage pEa_SNUABM_5 TaxID=2797313 RepID=A0A7T8EPB8_9CAUD|nr:putative transcriptional repressor [Erwinia phage pEa_SNUABM_5]QQO90187.1 putative transcriptional repressor [Erwinia phage pEa_SNUABM_5]